MRKRDILDGCVDAFGIGFLLQLRLGLCLLWFVYGLLGWWCQCSKRVGGFPLASLQDAGFAGEVYPGVSLDARSTPGYKLASLRDGWEGGEGNEDGKVLRHL